MSILRTIGKVVGGTIFYLAFSALIFAISFAQFSSHDNLKPLVVNTFENQLTQNSTQIQEIYYASNQTCNMPNQTSVPININSPYLNNINVNCSDIRNSMPTDLARMIASDLYEAIYSRNFACPTPSLNPIPVLQCLSNLGVDNAALFMISSSGQVFFKSLINLLIITSALSFVIMIVSIWNIFGIAKGLGINFIIIGIPYLLTPLIQSLIANQMPAEFSSFVLPIFSNFFLILNSKLSIIFFVGIALTIFGYLGSYFFKKKVKETKQK